MTKLAPEEKDAAQQFYLPLRSLLLVLTMFLFSDMVRESEPRFPMKTWNQLAFGLCDYLALAGVPAHLRRTELGIELLLGTLGLRIADDGHVFLKDHLTLPTFEHVLVPARADAPWRRAEFEAAFADYRTKHHWKINAAHPVRRRQPVNPGTSA